MKVEIEVRAFGEEDVAGTVNAYKSSEFIRVHELSEDKTLRDIQSLMAKLFKEVESGYATPEQCLGKITIRMKKENEEIEFLG
ncbi:hypothetical protein NCCP2716_30110 [Sporosarcina sp. NCCP-2716]|uniref:hypothetical protein n=1 Tax=Sporosarcina sp. NCCP-2716 TaxID=2943679 RepID=UPI00203F1D5F|nr:hypothetical protein [Sporosarcina sp. NCCP-2716]GKV70513.1 hypothetical protein NCCP2716_30110 [Sporosarcina sp. NCCP-2716]